MINTLTAYFPDRKLNFFTHLNQLFQTFFPAAADFCLVTSLRQGFGLNSRSLDPFYKFGKMDG